MVVGRGKGAEKSKPQKSHLGPTQNMHTIWNGNMRETNSKMKTIDQKTDYSRLR